MQTITDTIPAEIFESVVKYYNRNGYELKSFLLITSDKYSATFTR